MKDEYISKQAAIDDICETANDLQDVLIPVYYMGLIKALPAADVVPVIHSEWEHHMSFGVCRNCKYEYNWTGTDAKNFCPNCGAKMDGERKENCNEAD